MSFRLIERHSLIFNRILISEQKAVRWTVNLQRKFFDIDFFPLIPQSLHIAGHTSTNMCLFFLFFFSFVLCSDSAWLKINGDEICLFKRLYSFTVRTTEAVR